MIHILILIRNIINERTNETTEIDERRVVYFCCCCFNLFPKLSYFNKQKIFFLNFKADAEMSNLSTRKTGYYSI